MTTENQPQQTEPVSMGRIGDRPYWVLLLSVGIRAVHQVGAALFLATLILGMAAQPPRWILLFTVLSGLALLVTEWLRHRQLWRELSGLATMIKLGSLGAAYHQLLPAQPTVLVIFLLASICAHAPKNIRHRLLY